LWGREAACRGNDKLCVCEGGGGSSRGAQHVVQQQRRVTVSIGHVDSGEPCTDLVIGRNCEGLGLQSSAVAKSSVVWQSWDVKQRGSQKRVP
jgi:hypothetical protein